MSEDDDLYRERGLAAPAPDYSKLQGVLLSLSEDEYSRAHSLRPDWFDEDEEGVTLYAARVEFIYELIVTFRWDRLRSRQALASIWGARVSLVDSMHRECKRRLSAHLPDKAALQNLCIEQIQFVTQAAMNAKKGVVVQDEDGSRVEYVDAPDYKAAITGIDKLAEYIDLKGPRKMTPKKTQLEETSLEDLLTLMNQRMKEIKEGPKNDERILDKNQPISALSEFEPDARDPVYDSSVEE